MYNINAHSRNDNLAFYSFREFPTFGVALSSFFDHGLQAFDNRFEVTEKEGGYDLTLELPGFKPADLSIELEKGTLIVHAKNARNEVSQSITVGEEIDTEKVEAKLEDGLLRISLIKVEKAKPKRILLK